MRRFLRYFHRSSRTMMSVRMVCVLVVVYVTLLVLSLCTMFEVSPWYLSTKVKTNDILRSHYDTDEDVWYKKFRPDSTEGFDITINFAVPSWTELKDRLGWVEPGGRYKPHTTSPSHKLMIIVPYRDRLVQLKMFLEHIHPFLHKQNLLYVIYVVQMEAEGLFRKTVLMNAGFNEVTRLEDVNCVIYHDVDMLPLDDENLYYCDNGIRHLASASQQFNFKLPYTGYIGGAIAFPVELYRRVNGYSNLYSGWGGEDDDMYLRLYAKGIHVTHQDNRIGRYAARPHRRQPQLVNRFAFIETAVERMDSDGLNSVNYRVEVMEERPLFTWILIRTNHTEDGSYKNITPVYMEDPFINWAT